MKKMHWRLFAVILFLFVGGCTPVKEKESCTSEEMLLTENMVPLGFSIEWYVLPPALPKEGAEQASGVVFWKDESEENGILQNTAYIYKNSFLASFYYWLNYRILSPPDWYFLKGSDEWEIKSDARKIVCTGSRCIAVLRYNSVLIELNEPRDGEIVSEKEFKAMVLTIDQLVQACQK